MDFLTSWGTDYFVVSSAFSHKTINYNLFTYQQKYCKLCSMCADTFLKIANYIAKKLQVICSYCHILKLLIILISVNAIITNN